MILNPPFTKTNVQAGDPLTAQAWNDVVDAVAAIYQHIETSGAANVKVQVSGPNLVLSTVRVTATRSDGVVMEAVRPVTDTLHSFPGLPAGSYTIRAEAPGFEPATVNLAVSSTTPPATQNIALTRRGNFMPLLFGLRLSDALAQLGTLTIAVNNILDATGQSVPVANPGQTAGAAMVLSQFPAPGVPVAAGEFAQLLISASLTVQPTVSMPSLVGLTLAEATRALEAAGLRVGTTSTRGRGGRTTGGGGAGGGTGGASPIIDNPQT